MHIRPHHCRNKTMAGNITIVPCANHGNIGYGIQLYRGTMAGMRTNEETSGFKLTCEFLRTTPSSSEGAWNGRQPF